MQSNSGHPLTYMLCKKLFTKNMAEAFSVSAMLDYFITYNKYEEGLKYIFRLKLNEIDRTKLVRAFKSYEKSC